MNIVRVILVMLVLVGWGLWKAVGGAPQRSRRSVGEGRLSRQDLVQVQNNLSGARNMADQAFRATCSLVSPENAPCTSVYSRAQEGSYPDFNLHTIDVTNPQVVATEAEAVLNQYMVLLDSLIDDIKKQYGPERARKLFALKRRLRGASRQLRLLVGSNPQPNAPEVSTPAPASPDRTHINDGHLKLLARVNVELSDMLTAFDQTLRHLAH